jgi:hypothetical protein
VKEIIMRENLSSDLLYYLNRNETLKVEKCSDTDGNFLLGLDLPGELFSLLRWTWPTKSGDIGPYRICPVKEIVETMRNWPTFQSNFMLPIGYALNGDGLVLRYKPEGMVEVGLISHEEMLDESKEQNLNGIYACVVPTLEEFLLRAAEGLYLPIDFYAARELESLRAEIGVKKVPGKFKSGFPGKEE